MNDETNLKLENFERAFSSRILSCRLTCNCGMVYYENSPSWTWNDGELEELYKNPKAVCLDYSPGGVSFNGKLYANACNCWHENAKKIISYIESYDREIAAYLNLERARKIKEANSMPLVDT